MPAIRFADAALGVSTSHLRRRRVLATHVLSSARAGRSVNLLLRWAARSPGDATDPAYEAHAVSIVAWATAVWEGLPAKRILEGALARQKRRQEGTKEKHRWKKVKGPAGALLATCAQMGWEVVDAETLRTDLGDEVSFKKRSPTWKTRASPEASTGKFPMK